MRALEVKCQYFMNYKEMYADMRDHYVTIVTEDEPNSRKEIVSTAIQFITEPNYIAMQAVESLRYPDTPSDSTGYVRIAFEVLDENKAKIKMIATRTLSHPDLIHVSKKHPLEDGSSVEVHPVGAFQKLYKTNSGCVYPFIKFNIRNSPEDANLLSFLKYDKVNYAQKALRKVDELISSDNHKLVENVNSNQFKTMVNNLYHLTIHERLLHVQTYISLGNIINLIFQEITNKKYSVRFVIKSNDGLKDIIPENIEENYPQNVITLIEAGSDEMIWTHAANILKLVLKIATEIAIAVKFGPTVIFLKDIDLLISHQSFQYISSVAVEEKLGYLDDVQETPEINFLQNIIKVCGYLDIQAIIEYSGYVCATKCNILLCDGITCSNFNEVPHSNMDDIFNDISEFIGIY